MRVLATFLREHYTTKSDTASALAAYVSGFSGGGATGVRSRGTGVAVPANTPGERRPADRRRRNDSDATATEDDARTNAKPVEDTTAGRRRRATNLSGEDEKRRNRSDSDATEDDARSNAKPVEDITAGRRRRAIGLSGEGEKRRNRGDGDVPRPPGNIDATPAPRRSNVPAHDSAPRDAADPISRLRSYLSSGLGFEGTIAEAAKIGPPKGRKHRNRVDDIEPAPPDAQATAKTIVDAPPPATSDAADPAAPLEDSASPPSAPSVPRDITSTRTEQ